MGGGESCSHFTKKTIATIISLVLLLCISFSNEFLKSAFAKENSETISGTITLTVEPNPMKPNQDPDPVLISDPIQDSLKPLLAKTGDFLPCTILLLLIVGFGFAAVILATRRHAHITGRYLESYFFTAKAKKMLIVMLFALMTIITALGIYRVASEFLSGSAMANEKDNAKIASIEAEVYAKGNGSVVSHELKVTNHLKSSIKFVDISAKQGSLFSSIVDGKIMLEDIEISPGETLEASWEVDEPINEELINAALISDNYTLIDEIILKVIYETYFVSYNLNYDNNETYGDVQEIISGENATPPVTDPDRYNYEFKGWNTLQDGSGDVVNSDYLIANPILSDTIFYAKWHGPQVIFTKKSNDPELPCKIFTGVDKTTGFKTIDEVKSVAKDIAQGKPNPNSEIYNASNDTWHLFAKISGDGKKPNDWIECRIIHVGDHDGDCTGLTFQTVHSLEKAISYDTAYNKDIGITPYVGNWAQSTLKLYLNTTFYDMMPKSLQKSLISVTKKTNSTPGKTYIWRQESIETIDKVWILSYTEFVKNGGDKESLWGTNANAHDGSIYSYWDQFDLVVSKKQASGSLQQKLIKPLHYDREGIKVKTTGTDSSYSWMRSVSPDNNTAAMIFQEEGIIFPYSGYTPNKQLCIAPSFAI